MDMELYCIQYVCTTPTSLFALSLSPLSDLYQTAVTIHNRFSHNSIHNFDDADHRPRSRVSYALPISHNMHMNMNMSIICSTTLRLNLSCHRMPARPARTRPRRDHESFRHRISRRASPRASAARHDLDRRPRRGRRRERRRRRTARARRHHCCARGLVDRAPNGVALVSWAADSGTVARRQLRPPHR